MLCTRPATLAYGPCLSSLTRHIPVCCFLNYCDISASPGTPAKLQIRHPRADLTVLSLPHSFMIFMASHGNKEVVEVCCCLQWKSGGRRCSSSSFCQHRDEELPLSKEAHTQAQRRGLCPPWTNSNVLAHFIYLFIFIFLLI